MKPCLKQNLLLLGTILGCAVGFSLGLTLRSKTFTYPENEILFLNLISLPGELMMRAFKFLMIPILMTSIISGISNLGSVNSGRASIYAFGYYIVTTVIALFLGILLVLVIKPGFDENAPVAIRNSSRNSYQTKLQFLDLARNLVPNNIILPVISSEQNFIANSTSLDRFGKELVLKRSFGSSNIQGEILKKGVIS